MKKYLFDVKFLKMIISQVNYSNLVNIAVLLYLITARFHRQKLQSTFSSPLYLKILFKLFPEYLVKVIRAKVAQQYQHRLRTGVTKELSIGELRVLMAKALDV